MFVCDSCGISCSRYFNLQRHFLKAHNITLVKSECKNREKKTQKKNKNNVSNFGTSTTCTFTSESELPCPIGECEHHGTSKNLEYHYVNYHNIELVKEVLSFKNSTEFKDWKYNVEKSNNCRFVSHTGRKPKYEYYYCHRSGRFSSRSTGKRSLKTQGSNKFDSHCPAKICAKILKDGKFSVDFIPTHVGHEHDLRHLTISPNIKKQLAQKMLNKIPKNIIIDEVRDSVTDKIERVHLLTKQDMYNIAREFKIPVDGLRKNKNDAVSNDILVQQLQKSAKTATDISQTELLNVADECKTCIHNNEYTCHDYIQWNMCKHVHQVCLLLNTQDNHPQNKTVQLHAGQEESEQQDVLNEEIINEIKIEKNKNTNEQIRCLIESIQNVIRTPEDENYFHSELLKLKNHFEVKNSMKETPKLMLMLKPTAESEGEKKNKIEGSCSNSSKIVPQQRPYSII